MNAPRKPLDFNDHLAKTLRGTREEVELAHDEATLTELGTLVASDLHFLDTMGGEDRTWIALQAERAQKTAVSRKAQEEADQLPPVAPQVTLTRPETEALLRVLHRTRSTLEREEWDGRKVLDEVSGDLAERLGRAIGTAEAATRGQRDAHVKQAVARHQRYQKAARTRRERSSRARGKEGRP